VPEEPLPEVEALALEEPTVLPLDEPVAEPLLVDPVPVVPVPLVVVSLGASGETAPPHAASAIASGIQTAVIFGQKRMVPPP
jgi:hypothetical protein